MYVVMALLLFFVFSANALAQVSASDTSLPTLQDVSDPEDLSSLTEAQQKAQQLATMLIGKRKSSPVAAQRPLLKVMVGQTGRFSIPLFKVAHFEGRFVGGPWTFISPVDYAPSSVQEDARRPLFIPASEEALMALEILAK